MNQPDLGEQAISKAAEKYADNTTGKVRMENEAILIVGRK